ncbi:MAG: 30S ribosomal protein S13 [Candidatus Diapherotrites archaeon]|nr:30S ribosomal protein S13 [Candidatus Diapherotrites archaeon]
MSEKEQKKETRKEGKKEKQKETRKEGKQVFKSIVRVAGKDLNGDLPIYRALTGLKGIGHRTSKIFAIVFENQTGINYDSKLSTLNEQQIALLENIITNPTQYNIPPWTLNRRNEFESGEDKHLIMSDLEFDIRNTLKRLGEIKSYRGLRHSWGLPVRGQRTKSTHRGKGGVVGVLKKETAKAAATQKPKQQQKNK